MSTAARILAIDDELVWRENFAAWIMEDIAIQDSAASAQEAVERIRRFHYDLVLLDLSMDLANSLNRDNRAIQEYLATKPEGTRYFVVSSIAGKEDAVEAAFKLGASYVFFKQSLVPGDIATKAAATIAEAASHRGEAVLAARRKLIQDSFHDNQILGVLQPDQGASGMYAIFDALFRAVAPIGQHRDRPHFNIASGCVVALLWSRRHGTAVSAVLANQTVGEAAALASLADWLGFPTRGATLLSSEMRHVWIRAFEEPSIDDAHFDLPAIKLTA